MKPSSSEEAVANAPEGSKGRFGDLGGTGGGTRVFDPGGLSHKTAGRFKVSGAGSSWPPPTLPPDVALFSDEEPSGEAELETTLVEAGIPEVDVAPSGE
jgi:hypothetical protein